MKIITRKFANYRGLVRTLLADLMWRLGPYRKYGHVDWTKVKRLVFICQGNVCRSPFAHYLAQANNSELPVVSFGLATTTGVAADSVAMDVARDFGLDMSDHRATDIHDFEIQEGDLLIVMEDRHIFHLRDHYLIDDGDNVQVCLLGLWCRPRFALLYDPFLHPRTYFLSCYNRIDRAVNNLVHEFQSFQPPNRSG